MLQLPRGWHLILPYPSSSMLSATRTYRPIYGVSSTAEGVDTVCDPKLSRRLRMELPLSVQLVCLGSADCECFRGGCLTIRLQHSGIWISVDKTNFVQLEYIIWISSCQIRSRSWWTDTLLRRSSALYGRWTGSGENWFSQLIRSILEWSANR